MFYLLLLAVQFGAQPILTRSYTRPGITRSTVILMQEAVKFLIALSMLRISDPAREATKGACPGRIRAGSTHDYGRFSRSLARSLDAGSRCVCSHIRFFALFV